MKRFLFPLFLSLSSAFLLTPPLVAQPPSTAENPTNSQRLLEDSNIQQRPRPSRKIADYSIQLASEELEGNPVQRTHWIGPVSFQTDLIQHWSVVDRPNRMNPSSLELTRLGNDQIRLRLNWISKDDFVQEREALWGYAKYLVGTPTPGWVTELITEYPPNPPRKPVNYLGRIPWVIKYRLTHQETEETWIREDIFLEFPQAWLNIQLESPVAFFEANSKSLDRLLRFGTLLRP